MLYVIVLDGPNAATARPVVASKDPEIVQVVTDAIAARLKTKPTDGDLSLVPKPASAADETADSGRPE